MWLTIIFIIIGIGFRLLPHVPNFSPLAAVALFAGVYCNKRHGWLLPLAIYIVSDFIIGMHDTVLFTWFSMVLIYFLGRQLGKRKTAVSTLGFAVLSSALFFVITNLGVWIMGWYPHTVDGLIQCFFYALPFFRVSLLSDLVYVVIFFGSYEFLSKTIPAKQTA